MRVYEIAKEVGVTSYDVLAAAKNVGVGAASAISMVDGVEAQKIKEAREQGDLSENAEYDAAKDEQRDIEARIEEIEALLKNVEVVVEEEVDLDKISVGCKVKIYDCEFEEELEYYIVGSTEKNTPEAIEWCRTLARTLGFARISVLSPAEHDHMIGYVSQLCHAIAVSLMCASDNTELAKYTGDSFRDLTRIAHINDKMWAELFLWNKDNLISEIDMFSDALATMRQKLVDDDREGLEKMFRLSTERRKAFDKK